MSNLKPLSYRDAPPEVIEQYQSSHADTKVIRNWLLKEYESQTGQTIDLTNYTKAQMEELSSWFAWQKINGCDPITVHKPGRSHNIVFSDLSEKAIILSQRGCHICTGGRALDDMFPVNVIPINISPVSRQSIDGPTFRAFQAAIRERLSGRNIELGKTGRLCVALTFVMSSNQRDKDIDNMTKAIQDAVARALEFNDAHIHHLDAIKIIHDFPEEFLVIRLAPSAMNEHDEVLAPIFKHSWGGAERLDLARFMQDGDE